MPAPQRYAAPHEQIRVLAVEARREGVSFEDFWHRAIRPGQKLVTTETVQSSPAPAGAVVWPRDSADRANAIAATNGAKEFWHRAYNRVPPTRGERALGVLHGLLFEKPASSGSEDGTAVLCRT